MNRILLLAALCLVLLVMMNGCSSNKHRVFAASGTVIGLEVSQHPATQSPQMKLGYNRAEFAVVPTNRDDDTAAGATGSGATDVSDVLMELKYKGLFGGGDSGIYQRLAVGPNAVNQPGAWLMFLKDNAGQVSAANAQALADIVAAVPVLDARPELGDLARDYAAGDAALRSRFDVAAGSMGFAGFSGFLEAEPSETQIRTLKSKLNP